MIITPFKWDTMSKTIDLLNVQKKDLEIALITAIEHGDVVEAQLHHINNQLTIEIKEREKVEVQLHSLVKNLNCQKSDLELLVETIASHGDEINIVMEEKLSSIETIAKTDALTNLWNRRYFDEVFDKEWNRNVRSETSLALLILDIDNFKLYNDTYGHHEGDQCLQKIAYALNNIPRRSGEFVARYGGEEFVVILPLSDLTHTLVLAEYIRQSIIDLQIKHKNTPYGYVTVSIGVSSIVPQYHQSSQILFNQADKNLYLAKKQGRNCIGTMSNTHQKSVEINDTIGNFTNVISQLSQGEHLQISFQPNSTPIKERWRNNGLSADFMGDYVTTFLPKNDKDSHTVLHQKEIKSAVSYIANELLENAMKYSDNHINNVISINLILEEKQIILTASNSVSNESAKHYRDIVFKLNQSDPMEMYLAQLEAQAMGNNNTSGLGFLTMINDYNAELAWQFKSSKIQKNVTVFIEVRLPL
jgi:diguanylate cyclase (GGDEF)-like protein